MTKSDTYKWNHVNNKCEDHLLLFWAQQTPFTLEEKINRITIAETIKDC